MMRVLKSFMADPGPVGVHLFFLVLSLFGIHATWGNFSVYPFTLAISILGVFANLRLMLWKRRGPNK